MINQSRPKDATHFDGTGFIKRGKHNLIYKHNPNDNKWYNRGKGELLPSQSLEALDNLARKPADLRSFETLTVFDQ